MRLKFIPIHFFRETPSVTFFDAGVSGTNGTDVVVHRGAATSPPDANGFEQYYVQGIKWITIWCSRDSAPSFC